MRGMRCSSRTVWCMGYARQGGEEVVGWFFLFCPSVGILGALQRDNVSVIL